MKIFLCDFSSAELIGVAGELKKRGADILYWTGAKARFETNSRDKEKWPAVVFHNIFDAVRAIPPSGLDIRKFPPPSADLITSMLECESLALTMMNRMDFDNMPLSEKKHLYYKYLSYWNGVLDSLEPEAIVFGEIPHAVYNFVLYSLAKARGIKTVMPATSTLWGWLNLVTDYTKNDERLLREFKRIENETHSIEELHPALKTYCLNLLNQKTDPTPPFNKEHGSRMKNKFLIVPDWPRIIKYLKSGELPKRAYWHLKSILFSKKQVLQLDEDDSTNYSNLLVIRKINKIKQKLKNEYLALQKDADFAKKFVYLPLHFQPERSTSPMGGYFVDQILLAKTVAAALPEGWLLYIKEYPLQWNQYSYRAHLSRYRGYYKELAGIEKTYLISTEISTYELIRRAQAVAVTTSTTGWEALVLGKPVLVFGYPWYMYCNGVFRIDSTEKCRQALDEIIKGYEPDPQKVLNYFVAFQRVAIRTNQLLKYQPSKDISQEEAIKNLTRAFLDELS